MGTRTSTWQTQVKPILSFWLLAFFLQVTEKTKDKNIIYPTIKFAKAVIDMVYSFTCV